MGTISFYQAPDGRDYEAGGHEVYAAMLFADGVIGSGDGPVGITISTAADGTALAYDDWQHRPGSGVVGWVPVCECGWRGEPWARVGHPLEEDMPARRAYSPDHYAPEVVEDDPQGPTHARPFALLSYVSDCAREAREASTALAEAVAAAREYGAPWEGIGRAAGMSRQAAHERWST